MPKFLRKRAGAKVPIVLLSAFLFILLLVSAASAAVYGDINDDGDINVQDVVLVMKHVLELETLTAAQLTTADVNGDGAINVQDVTLIMQHTLGLIDEFDMAELQVSSVTAENPKQVEVVFNRILNSEEQGKMIAANFHVGLYGTPETNRLTGTGSAVAVLDDNKTVLLTLGDGYKFTSGTTTNRAIVREAVGLDADYTVSSLVFIDSEVPTLLSVESISPTTIVMTFSEPLDKSILVPTSITLNSGAIALNLAGAVYTDSQRELTINTFTNLSAGVYTIGIASGTNLKDYTGYGVVPVSKTFTHTPVTTAPTVSAKSSTETSVTLEFSGPINAATLVGNANVLFRHTYDTTIYEVTGAAVSNPSGDNKTFVVLFGSAKLLPPGSTTVWLKYTTGTADANKIKDTWGNIIAPVSFTIVTVPDTVLPTATVSVVSASNTQIDVQYSEQVQGATVLANYSLIKATATVNIVSIIDQGGYKYRLTTATPMQSVHTLTISNIKDSSISENLMGTQTYTIDVPDTIVPKVVNLLGIEDDEFYWQATNNKVRIFFSEPMNATDLANITMYENVDDTYAKATVAFPGPDGKSVFLEFANNVVTGAGDGLRVGALRDLAGNSLGISTTLITGVSYVFGLDSSIADNLSATSPTTVKASLNDPVVSADVNDFEIRIDASPVTWVKPASISIDNGTEISVLTFTLSGANALYYDALDNDDAVTQVRTVSALNTPGPATNTKNDFGISANFAATTIVDRILPALLTAKVTSPLTIELTFSEKLDTGTFTSTTNGFSVTGGAYTLFTVTVGTDPNNYKVTITKTAAGDDFITGTSSVSYNSVFGHKDLVGNVLAGFTFVVTTP